MLYLERIFPKGFAFLSSTKRFYLVREVEDVRVAFESGIEKLEAFGSGTKRSLALTAVLVVKVGDN